MATNNTTNSASDFATELNDLISFSIQEDEKLKKKEGKEEQESIFSRNFDTILSEFQQPNSENDIYKRLALIDLFYSTNVYRMQQFGLSELAKAIHDIQSSLPYSYTGNPFPPKIKDLFDNDYGYKRDKQNNSYKKTKAISLISKYLFFDSIAKNSSKAQIIFGFPIYDSIVCNLIPTVAQKLGIKTPQDTKTDIEKYCKVLWQIEQALETNNSKLWNDSNMTKFQRLDYILWRIGKAKKGSYSLLMTKTEYIDFLKKGTLPTRIGKWKNFPI